MTGYGGSFTSTNSLGIASEQQQSQKEVELDDSDNKDSGNTKNLDLSNRYDILLCFRSYFYCIVVQHFWQHYVCAFHFNFSEIVFFHDPLLAFEKCGAGPPWQSLCFTNKSSWRLSCWLLYIGRGQRQCCFFIYLIFSWKVRTTNLL